MSYALTEEQQLIKQSVRDFALEFVTPAAAEIDNSGDYPEDVVRMMAEHDFLGLFLPAEFNGAEAGYLSYILAVEELSRVSGGVASILIQHASFVAYAINRWGSPQQKEKYLPAMCQGDKLGAFALNDPAAVIAGKEGDGYVLNGCKSYVANAGAAGVYIVFALTNPEAGPKKGMSAFLVDAETPGLTVGRQVEKMGLRGCQSAEVTFENVRLSQESLLGSEDAGLVIATETLAVGNIAAGAQMVGIAQAAMEDAAKYAKQRVQFGRPIAKFPAIQTMLAEMAANIHLARLAIYNAAQLIEKGEPVMTEAAIVKFSVSRIGQNALIDAVQIEGGYGYSEEMPVSRFYRDVKGTAIMDSSLEFPEKVIADSVLE
ncbi:MAG: acyl-CoA dehydrogenase family protein [Veillonellales bacterium]